MATSKAYRDYILENLNCLDNILCRPMMGEYLLYYNGHLFGGIYDDCFLIKKTLTNQGFHLEERIPYPNAKPMYFVSEVEDKELLQKIILETCKGLSSKKK